MVQSVTETEGPAIMGQTIHCLLESVRNWPSSSSMYQLLLRLAVKVIEQLLGYEHTFI